MCCISIIEPNVRNCIYSWRFLIVCFFSIHIEHPLVCFAPLFVRTFFFHPFILLRNPISPFAMLFRASPHSNFCDHFRFPFISIDLPILIGSRLFFMISLLTLANLFSLMYFQIACLTFSRQMLYLASNVFFSFFFFAKEDLLFCEIAIFTLMYLLLQCDLYVSLFHPESF